MVTRTAFPCLPAILALASAGLLPAANTTGATQARVTASYARIPMSFESCFEPMCAEVGSQAKFFSRGSGYDLFLTSTGAVLRGGRSRKSTLRIELVRSNSNPRIEGSDPLPGKSNYFFGKHSKNWRSNVTNYARVRYRNVYPGVDLVFYGNGSQLEYDFVVAAGADPRAVTLTFSGAGSISVDKRGDLMLATDNGEIVQRKPVVWQQIGEKRKQIAVRYVLTGKNKVGFELGPYDSGAAMVIDPVLVYSTFLGAFAHLAVDAAGNAYVAVSLGAEGSLVTKLDSTGTTVIYSTYIGGSGTQDIALDAAGNVYVTGVAIPSKFPTTPGAYQTQEPIGSRPPFITKLNATGTALDYSTYLSPADGASLSLGPGLPFVLACCIAVDSEGSAYVTGTTQSKTFPTTPGAFQTRSDGGWSTFVTKLNPTGTALSYSTYLGGGGQGPVLTGMTQDSTGIAVDAAGNAYVAGWSTGAADFPTTPGAVRFPFGGFVTKLNPTGSALVYSTTLYGALPVTAMTVDSAGAVYVAGFNLIGEFPTTPGAFNAGGGGTAWLAKLNDAGTTLVYATHIAPLGVIARIAVDLDGNAYVAGRTSSRDFPTTPDAFQKVFAGGHSFAEEGIDSDAFVMKLNAAGTALIYSTYLGGTGDEWVSGIGLDAAGNVYVAGGTDSPDFPTTPGAWQPSSTGGGFLAKLEAPGAAVVPLFQPSSVVNAAGFLPGPVAPGEIVTLFGTGTPNRRQHRWRARF